MGVGLHIGILLVTVLTLSACSAPAKAPTVIAVADLDNDGVSDEHDLCTDTRVPQPVDETGCPIFKGALPNVDFAANSADLNRAARASLDELVRQLKSHPAVVVSVDGHTDNRGSGIRNLALSKQRVLAVVRYLVARGVNPKRLRPFGYGESRPAVSNASAEGREQNRRIEVSVILPEENPLVLPVEAERAEPAEQTVASSVDET